MPAHPQMRPRSICSLAVLLALGGGSALAAPDVFIAYPPQDYRVRYIDGKCGDIYSQRMGVGVMYATLETS